MDRRSPFLLSLFALALLAATTLRGDQGPDKPADRKSGSPQSRAILHDIQQLRREVGVDVLRGTILASDPLEEEQAFSAGLRRVLGEPEPESQPNTEKLDPSEMVRSLRYHGGKLDQLANRLETRRQYDEADQLRMTSKALRRIARQLDTSAQQ